MDKKVVLLLCAMLLLAADTEGLSINGNGRCLCPGAGSRSVRANLVKSVHFYSESPGCEKKEVIAILKKGQEKRCLDWNSKKVQKLVQTMKKSSSRNAKKKSKGKKSA
ncbi:C-X-C motif chemokine 10-like [Lissotriton helveticus]